MILTSELLIYAGKFDKMNLGHTDTHTHAPVCTWHCAEMLNKLQPQKMKDFLISHCQHVYHSLNHYHTLWTYVTPVPSCCFPCANQHVIVSTCVGYTQFLAFLSALTRCVSTHKHTQNAQSSHWILKVMSTSNLKNKISLEPTRNSLTGSH